MDDDDVPDSTESRGRRPSSHGYWEGLHGGCGRDGEWRADDIKSGVVWMDGNVTSARTVLPHPESWHVCRLETQAEAQAEAPRDDIRDLQLSPTRLKHLSDDVAW